MKKRKRRTANLFDVPDAYLAALHRTERRDKWAAFLITASIVVLPVASAYSYLWYFSMSLSPIVFGIDVTTGDVARQQILAREDAKGNALPDGARDFYYFDGGSVFGSAIYWSFTCRTEEDCLTAMRNLAPSQKFEDWSPSRYAVVMKGPAFYGEEYKTHRWDVTATRHGLVSESVEGNHESMYFYAVDLDQKRVFHHYEGGGFRPDPFPHDVASR